MVGLSDRENHFPKELSGGQQQRLAIARAIALEHDIILADEPTGNLDESSCVEIMKLLKEIYKKGKTVIVVTHDKNVAKKAGTIKGIVGISAQKTIPGELKTKYGSFNVNLECVMYDYRYFDKNGLDKGKYFSISEYQNAFPVGVISYKDAMRMFGTSDVIGKTVDISVGQKKITYIIEGVQTKNSSVQMEDVYSDTPVQMIVPMTVSNRFYGTELNKYSEIFILVNEDYDIEIVGNNAINILLHRNNMKIGDLQISYSNDYIEMVDNILLLVTAILAILGVISIFVGGIGVTNIMLLNVKLRTNEIGIRKAMGAKDKDILKQFIVETAIITGIGGIIGIFVGVMMSRIICMVIEWNSDILVDVNLSWTAVVITLFFSVSLGVICGVMPAKCAAKLEPVVAFRQ